MFATQVPPQDILMRVQVECNIKLRGKMLVEA